MLFYLSYLPVRKRKFILLTNVIQGTLDYRCVIKFTLKHKMLLNCHLIYLIRLQFLFDWTHSFSKKMVLIMQLVVSAPSGNLLEIHIFRSQPRPTEPETLQQGPVTCMLISPHVILTVKYCAKRVVFKTVEVGVCLPVEELRPLLLSQFPLKKQYGF